MYRLIYLNGTMKGRRVAVREGSVVLGRDPQADVEIAGDEEAAPRHAVIAPRGDDFVFRDETGLEGVKVNGVPGREFVLKHGDKLGIGRTEIEFQKIIEHAPVDARRRPGVLLWVMAVIIGVIVVTQVVLPFLRPVTVDMHLHGKAVRWHEQQKQMAAESNAVTQTDTSTNALSVARQQIAAIAPELTNAVATNVATFTPVIPSSIEIPPTVRPVLPSVPLTPPMARPSLELPAVAPPVSRQPPPLTVAAGDPVMQAVRQLMDGARQETATNGFEQADQTLDRAETMMPNYTPAFVERATLYEKREMFKEAGAHWRKITGLAEGTPLAVRAAKEQERMAELERIQRSRPPPPPPVDARLLKKIRIISVERERYPAGAEFDEMRVLRINLRAGTNAVDAADVRVAVTFYDRDAANGREAVTRAIGPAAPLRVTGPWPAGGMKAVTATYTVPRGFRIREEREIHEARIYDGYRIRVFYKGVLADEDAMPFDLLKLPAPPLRPHPPADLPVLR